MCAIIVVHPTGGVKVDLHAIRREAAELGLTPAEFGAYVEREWEAAWAAAEEAEARYEERHGDAFSGHQDAPGHPGWFGVYG